MVGISRLLASFAVIFALLAIVAIQSTPFQGQTEGALLTSLLSTVNTLLYNTVGLNLNLKLNLLSDWNSVHKPCIGEVNKWSQLATLRTGLINFSILNILPKLNIPDTLCDLGIDLQADLDLEVGSLLAISLHGYQLDAQIGGILNINIGNGEISQYTIENALTKVIDGKLTCLIQLPVKLLGNVLHNIVLRGFKTPKKDFYPAQWRDNKYCSAGQYDPCRDNHAIWSLVPRRDQHQCTFRPISLLLQKLIIVSKILSPIPKCVLPCWQEPPTTTPPHVPSKPICTIGHLKYDPSCCASTDESKWDPKVCCRSESLCFTTQSALAPKCCNHAMFGNTEFPQGLRPICCATKVEGGKNVARTDFYSARWCCDQPNPTFIAADKCCDAVSSAVYPQITAQGSTFNPDACCDEDVVPTGYSAKFCCTHQVLDTQCFSGLTEQCCQDKQDDSPFYRSRCCSVITSENYDECCDGENPAAMCPDCSNPLSCQFNNEFCCSEDNFEQNIQSCCHSKQFPFLQDNDLKRQCCAKPLINTSTELLQACCHDHHNLISNDVDILRQCLDQPCEYEHDHCDYADRSSLIGITIGEL